MNNTITHANNGTDFTVKKEKTISKSILTTLQSDKTIKDVFTPKGGNTYEVKNTEDSEILQGHIKGCPLVPGVLLKELFLLHNNKQFIKNTRLSFQFHKPVLPGQNLVVKGDAIYDIEDNLVMTFSVISEDLEIDFDSDIENMSPIIPRLEEELDQFMIQTGKFRFVTGGGFTERKDKEVLNAGDKVKGFFRVPKDFPYTDKVEGIEYREDEKELPAVVNPNLLDEIAAQVGSLIVAYDFRSDKPKGKILTFQKTNFSMTDITLKTGDTFYIVGEITNITKREMSFLYIGKNQDNEEIIRGEITGNIVPKVLLKRMSK